MTSFSLSERGPVSDDGSKVRLLLLLRYLLWS